MRLSFIFALFILTILGVIACQYSFDESTGNNSGGNGSDNLNIHLQNILNKLSPIDSNYTFIAEDGFEYEFSSGTKILIPKNALTFQDGALVNGSVNLTFQEYRDALDLMATGFYSLPKMSSTAGAFKIEMTQHGIPLLLDPTQSIEVKSATYEKEDNFSLFYFDHQNHIWDSLFSVKPEINDFHVQLEREIKRMKPDLKFPLDEDYLAFSYKGILDVFYNENLTNVNHPQIQKKMEQYGLRWSSINVEAFLNFEGKREFAALMIWKNISRKAIPEWAKNSKGVLTKIKKNRYRLTVEEEGGKRKFSTQVEAIMSLKDLFAFGPGFWKNDYERSVKKARNADKDLKSLATAYRTFKVNRFGFYNWKKSIEEIDQVDIIANFKNEKDQRKIDACFYLLADGNSFAYYPSSQWNKFALYDDPQAKIFSFTKDGELCIFPFEEMQEIEFSQLKKMNNPSFIFKLEPTGQIPESLDELREALLTNP